MMDVLLQGVVCGLSIGLIMWGFWWVVATIFAAARAVPGAPSISE